ncbi:hypothetical protein [Streptomyces sp. CRN 30]|uniref:hypothetical protein n=1 Tax=Streptomyces sp. CRN 30 TaxID=3075613 RepID=UPI002A81EEE6|nr:hypothetical protein [Streptomyces sp. CRN 30]
MLERPGTAERWFRAVAAAVVATACLLLAANTTGRAPATEHPTVPAGPTVPATAG